MLKYVLFSLLPFSLYSQNTVSINKDVEKINVVFTKYTSGFERIDGKYSGLYSYSNESDRVVLVFENDGKVTIKIIGDFRSYKFDKNRVIRSDGKVYNGVDFEITPSFWGRQMFSLLNHKDKEAREHARDRLLYQTYPELFGLEVKIKWMENNGSTILRIKPSSIKIASDY
jgi:hypothetical protein